MHLLDYRMGGVHLLDYKVLCYHCDGEWEGGGKKDIHPNSPAADDF